MDKDALWYRNAVFYEVYVRAFFDSNDDGHGDLDGLTQKLDYLKELGVDCVWLLPIFPSPLKDDGYDIADYYGITPEYGTREDFKSLLEAAHSRGMRVITDLVLNHTSDQHPWFQAARRDRSSPYRDYYVWSDTDRKYNQARIIFTDSERSNWSWDEAAGQYYWHRFYSCQPDLNYANPAVRHEMLRVVEYWLELGVDGFRVDAVPYLFEEEGTNCENLPQTHAYLKEMRRFVDERYPGRILLCEANQWPLDVRPYFGEGDEFHMGFNFPLMPRIFMALKRGSREPLAWVLERTPVIPDSCQWCTFLRNHDELTLEMVTEAERQWMWAQYAPDRRMRLNLGIRRRLAPLLDNDRRKIELAFGLLFGLPGSPILYYGDEIGMGDHIQLPDRNGVRTPMQWDRTRNGGFSGAEPTALYSPVNRTLPYSPKYVNLALQRSDPSSLWSDIQRMVQIRKNHPAFALGSLTWAEPENDAVAAFWREYESEQVLAIYNLTGETQTPGFLITGRSPSRMTDLLTGRRITTSQEGKLKLNLAPYEYLWLVSNSQPE